MESATESIVAAPAAPASRAAWLARALLIVAGVCVYAHTLSAPFVLDDEVTILANPSLRDLAALDQVLWPPERVFSAGRPLLNLSFALNYAIGGTDARGYHAANIAIHLLGGLVLLAWLRRALLRVPARFTPRTALLTATLAALGWTLHPLATGAVTYVSQRAESLMALCYLSALYGLERAAKSATPRRWLVATVAAVVAGMATKETMVTAPLVLLLYDRAFLAGAWGAALRVRRGLYGALAASWGLLAALMLLSQVGRRGIGASADVSPWAYALAEFRAVFGYAKLALWPQPLVFDYGAEFIHGPAVLTIVAAGAVIIALAGAIALWRRSPRAGFGAVAFFILLAPTSSVVPIVVQPMAESRALLPTAAVVALVMLTALRLAGSRARFALAAGVAALALLAWDRNHDFRSALALWSDSVAKWPQSSRAQIHLGLALAAQPATRAAARANFEAALRLAPDSVEAHNGLGMILADSPAGRGAAQRHFETAIRLRSTYAEAHNNLANLLRRSPTRLRDAIAHYETAARLKPENASFHANLAQALARDPQRRAAAIREFETALRLAPDDAATHHNFALELARTPGREADAIAHFETALRLAPDDPELHYGIANVLDTIPSRVDDAIRHYARAIALRPTLAPAHNNLALALAQRGRIDDAIVQLEAGLRHVPDAVDLRENLRKLRAMRGR